MPKAKYHVGQTVRTKEITRQRHDAPIDDPLYADYPLLSYTIPPQTGEIINALDDTGEITYELEVVRSGHLTHFLEVSEDEITSTV